ncbi:uncharacterized protein LOC116294731 [Actinia tenebrosa]|uniref:Uncharacterized protein LOC116294731 n=1 Tax=Actinia tenebrosa TaxID=6105 RepID=A0A6P8HPC2_ACTTE|nr:uncharacterized protein LOC116294731 [Actinia tenebrosa]XP_031558240.1 uncharacterized protein LOC116294731 [Actinia tenebrosa]XP_031558241.1 uncharacterized protein LOC116294731 [Actinia tenebrosa]
MAVFYTFYLLYLLIATLIGLGCTSIRYKKSNYSVNCPLNDVIVSVFADPPYSRNNSTDGVMSDFIRLGIKLCFKSKSCTKTKDIQWKWVQSVDELESLIKNEQTNIAFPVPPSLSSRRTRFSVKARVEYFPILLSPGPALIVNNQACQRISKLLLVKSILSVWPILLLTLLLAGISGVLIWALEYHNKQRHFSKPFVKGSYDGFWWAVVSMTTVGYGDQIPRSIFGRLFGIAWILTGVTLIAVFTASITSAITVVSVKGSCNEMQGQRIAVINNSETEVTARHHGAVVKAYDDIMAMFSDLKSEQVDGILMDRLKGYYYLNIIDDDMLRVSRALQSLMPYSVAVVTGNMTDIITKNSCFMDLLANPRGKINRMMKRYIVPVKPMTSNEDTIGLFSSGSGALTNTILTITSLLVILLLCGCAWDRLYKTNNCFSSTGVPRQMLTNTNDIAMVNQSSVDQLAQIQSALNSLNEQILEVKVMVGGKAQEKEP